MLEVDLADRKTVQYIIHRFNLHLKHRLGQNFLIDPHVVQAIASAADLSEGTPVLEIGPGIGTLTQALARTGAEVTAFEIDETLERVLAHTLAPYPNVKIVYQDILHADLEAVLGEQNWHAAANLPYYITTPILMHLIQKARAVSVFVFMMQKEVAERIMAEPGSKAYGALTIAVQYYCTAEKVLDIPPAAFIPRPAVTSSVLKLCRRKEPAVSVKDESLFFRLVKMGFGQRRKIFANAMKNGGISEDLRTQILKMADVDGKRRGETFSLEEYARMADAWCDLR